MTPSTPPILAYADFAGDTIDSGQRFELTARSPVWQMTLLLIALMVTGAALAGVGVMVVTIRENRWGERLVVAMIGIAFLLAIACWLVRELVRLARFGYRKIVIAETAADVTVTHPGRWASARSWPKQELRKVTLRHTARTFTLRRVYTLRLCSGRLNDCRIPFVPQSDDQIAAMNAWIAGLHNATR